MRRNGLVFLAYVATSFAWFGCWHLLPHPGRPLLGSGMDPEIPVWSFAWWPHALLTGQNPFVSHALYAPAGIDLAWATSVPGLAVAFAPLTLAFGPVASYNVAALLMPALDAFTAYLLCRYLTRSLWPSLAGGYLFGFSAYVVSEELGHLHMTAVFLLPLVALAVLRHLREGTPLTWRLGLLLGAQLWISTELFFTVTLALGVGLLLAQRLPWRAVLGAYALAVAWAAPLVWYALTGFRSETLNEPARYDADLANLVVPTHIFAFATAGLTRISSRFPGGDAEHTAYLGIPLLAIVALYAWRGSRRLMAAFALAILAALGTSLHWQGHSEFRLPWHWVAKLPLFDNVLPARLMVYAALAASAMAALWLTRAPRRGAVVLGALAVVALVPAFWRPEYRYEPQRWELFSTNEVRICFPKDENVVIFPYGFRGDAMLWQAESGFWFRMAEGYLLPKPPKPFIDDPLVQKLTYTYENAGPREILAFARREHVARVLSVEQYQHPSGTVMHRFGPLQVLGGVMIAPACGYPPLTPQPHG